MDKFDDNEIGKLLRLKRFEQPPPGYFENFLHEFHRRQRDELLRQPLWRIAFERTRDFVASFEVARLASYPVAAAAVLVCATVLSLRISQTPPAPSLSQAGPIVREASAESGASWNLATPVSTRMVTVPAPALNARFLTHRAATPPRYVLDSMPVSYEPTLRF